MKPILSGQGIKELDRRAEDLGVSPLLLMEAAGRGAAARARELYPRAARGRVLALAGKGGNGGDALCMARWLGLWGAEPTVLLLGEPQGAAALQAQAFSACFPDRLIRVDSEEELRAWAEALAQAELVIDGVLGVGLSGPARGLAAAAIELLAGAQGPVVALDLPSGLLADTGEVTGPAAWAELTLAMGAYKPCHLLPPAAAHCGRLELVEVPYPPAAWEAAEPLAWILSREQVATMLPPRDRFGHKGTFGRVLVIGGAVGMAGAVALAAEAALRAGAGLVHVAVPAPIYGVVEGAVTEALVHPLLADGGAFSPEAAGRVLELMEGMDVVLLGPGLGRETGPAEVVQAALTSGHPKLVVDADGLFALAQDPKLLRKRQGELILTPHPGEFARLVGKEVHEVVAEKIEAAQAAAREWGAVVALKGPPTAIASPAGEVYLSATGNTALAHGGAGDVLAGLVAGLWAGGATALEAACAGVFAHGQAAELLAESGAQRALLPGDLFQVLPRVFLELEAADG